jgi:hypothetical protein
MPRLPRFELPGVPLHVTQRGINKGAIFLDADATTSGACFAELSASMALRCTRSS